MLAVVGYRMLRAGALQWCLILDSNRTIPYPEAENCDSGISIFNSSSYCTNKTALTELQPAAGWQPAAMRRH